MKHKKLRVSETSKILVDELRRELDRLNCDKKVAETIKEMDRLGLNEDKSGDK